MCKLAGRNVEPSKNWSPTPPSLSPSHSLMADRLLVHFAVKGQSGARHGQERCSPLDRRQTGLPSTLKCQTLLTLSCKAPSESPGPTPSSYRFTLCSITILPPPTPARPQTIKNSFSNSGSCFPADEAVLKGGRGAVFAGSTQDVLTPTPDELMPLKSSLELSSIYCHFSLGLGKDTPEVCHLNASGDCWTRRPEILLDQRS